MSIKIAGLSTWEWNRPSKPKKPLSEPTSLSTVLPWAMKTRKILYNKYAGNGRGFVAQGSEYGFGKMYARGINDKALVKGKDDFIQVVSCNTHNSPCSSTPSRWDRRRKIISREGRFVCMRRANDLSQEGEFIAAPEAGKHDDAEFGTHQGRDAHYL